MARLTETTPLLVESSPSPPQRARNHQDNSGRPNYILCPHAPSHRFHFMLVAPRSATGDNQDTPSDEGLSVIMEEEEEVPSISNEGSNSAGGSHRESQSSSEDLSTSQEQAVYLRQTMVPNPVSPGDRQTPEEDTWEVGCVAQLCWPFWCLLRKTDNDPDEHVRPRPAPQSGAESSDAELADDEYSSSTSSSVRSAPITVSPRLTIFVPPRRVFGRSGMRPEMRVL
ncbi:hypothetical protein ACHAPT_005762 [Fusarium lateritium]